MTAVAGSDAPTQQHDDSDDDQDEDDGSDSDKHAGSVHTREPNLTARYRGFLVARTIAFCGSCAVSMTPAWTWSEGAAAAELQP
jgi:hypothetical protein